MPVVKLSIKGEVVQPQMPKAFWPHVIEESPDSGSDTDSEIETEDALISRAQVSHATKPTSETDSEADDSDMSDTEDAPEWQFETGEIKSKDELYTFCPALHRAQILRLFSKHFCRHPFFSDRNGTHHTATQIRYLCV